ncbi:MAG: peptidoglycan DD-metalloendopeptidase family protein [Gammaproteobacteria bacterium]|jgi:lipoprotein NlpD
MQKKFLIFLISVFLCLSGCVNYNCAAPVQDVNVHRVGKVRYHLVQPGETLYAVAWRYEKDYRLLASLNHLHPPYAIKPGDLIRLNGAVNVKRTVRTKPMKIKQHWCWPVKHHSISRGFSSSNKGIDIAGYYNTPVFAAAKGQVVYAGNGIRGYGNLLIIKHNAVYLTAYACNSNLFVKQGQWVRAGQKIALMGMNDNLGKVALHFEIRRAGKAVNPLRYLS